MTMQSTTAQAKLGHLHAVHSGLDNTSSPTAQIAAPFSFDTPAQFGADPFGQGNAGTFLAPMLSATALAVPPASVSLSPTLSGPPPAQISGESSFAVVSTPGSGLVFDNTYTANCSAQYIACVVAAEQQLESLFTNSVTINETFDEENEGNNGDALGNTFYYFKYTYAQVRAAVLKLAPGDVLPATDPSGGANWEIPVAYARMLGLTTYTEPTDDTVTLNTYYGWDFGQDVINGLTHELSEGGMGRIGALGGSGGGNWSTMDLFRYNGSGQADYSNGRDGQTTYFSSNGGASLSNAGLPGKGAPTLSFNNQYNSNGTQANGGDTADWVQNNVFGSTGDGETLALTQTELEVMQALGWNLSLKQDVATTSGSWETPTDWSTGSMPIEAQDVYISAAAVSLDSNVIVNSIATAAGSALEIGDSTATTLTAVDGTTLNGKDSSFTATGNLGEILVYTGSTLQLGYVDESFDNAGTLTVGKGAGGTGYLDIAGEIDLSGGGTLNLGQTGSTGDILNAPTTTGDSLININNTISGSGLIELGETFDNQAAGLVNVESALQISAGTFTNEGGITVEAGARLDLGQDGTTQSLQESGSIAVLANSDLQISGNYTASGSGAIYLKGAGAEITSDGTAATFVNAGIIEADNTTLIGDANLSFTNSGSLAVSLAGNVLTIDTGANSVVNTGTLSAVNGGTLAIASNLTNQATVTAGGISGTETTTGTVELGLDGGTVSAANTGAIAVYADSDLAIRGNYTVSGSGDIALKGAGANITSDGLAPATFTNTSTIEALASGQIGDAGILSSNDLTFVNQGSVFALGSDVTLTLNTGANAINDAGGFIDAEDSATVFIDSNISTGAGGTIEADSGSELAIYGKLSGDGTLAANTGALVVIDGGGSFAGAITGSSEVVIGAATTLQAGASLSVLELADAANLTLASVGITNASANTFFLNANTGTTVTIGATGSGSQFTNAGQFLAEQGGTAAVNVAFVDTGLASVTAGTLRLNDGLTGTGTLSAGAGAIAFVTDGANFAGALSGAGTVEITGPLATLDAGASLSAATLIDSANLVLNSVALTNAAANDFTITAGSGKSIGITGAGSGSAFTNAGRFVSNGAGKASINVAFDDTGKVVVAAGTLAVNGALSGNGTLGADPGAILDLAGGGSFAGALTGPGTTEIAKAMTLTTGASLSATDIIDTANLTLNSVALSNGASHVFSLTASSGGTVMLNSTGTGSKFTNLGSLTANGAGTERIAVALVNTGLVSNTSGTLTFVGAVTNSGTIDAASGLTTINTTVSGTGKLELGAASTLSLALGAGSGQTVDFLAGTGLLDLAKPLDFLGTITGFGGSDQIDLLNTAETSFTYAGNLLTVKDGSATVAKLDFTGASNSFSLVSDAHGGTLITFG
jgi:hypothetical protein